MKLLAGKNLAAKTTTTITTTCIDQYQHEH